MKSGDRIYDQGYVDGESSVRADWYAALTEVLGDDFDATPTNTAEAIKKLQQESKRYWDKFRLYEDDYILPAFVWAKKWGVDLKALVAESKGNSSFRLYQWMDEKLTALRERDEVTATAILHWYEKGSLRMNAIVERLRRE